nr:sperm acrosome-associated protein 7 isoform X3 [Equus asinus]
MAASRGMLALLALLLYCWQEAELQPFRVLTGPITEIPSSSKTQEEIHGVLVKKKSNKNQNEKLSVLGKTLQTVGRSSGLADASRGREGGQWSLSLLQVYQPVLHQPIPAAPDTDVKGAFGKSQLPGTRVLLQENDKDILSSKWKRKSMAQKRRRAVSTAASSEGLPTAGNPPTHPTSGIKDLCRHTGMVSHP